MRILLIEDTEEYLGTFLTEIEKQYVVDVAYNSTDGSYLTSVNDYDAILVDVSLPEDEVVSLCRDTRSANIQSPILLLADSGSCSYKAESLEAGADVLLSKPISVRELTAQVTALIRRNYNYISQIATFKDFKIDMFNKNVTYTGNPVSLRRKEYDILEYLVINLNCTVSKEKLLEHVWCEGIYTESNTCEVQVRNLRLALAKFYKGEVIKTIRGYGYKIEV